jgi:16S rRNA (uracil1498-N3)-methyltransferase
MTKTIHRFFVDPADVAADRFPLPAPIRHQVTRVLRLAPGDELVLLDGLGAQVRSRLTERGDVEVLERSTAVGEPRHRLVVWQALIKGDGLERVVQQGTELGVAEFRLLVTARSVARDVSPRRLERLQMIAREAAEQSERGLVPPVRAPVPLVNVLRPGVVMLLERLDGNGTRLSRLDPPGEVIIGPEGGFDADEVAQAKRAGLTFAGLGPRILRSEAVAIAAAAIVLSRSGDFA